MTGASASQTGLAGPVGDRKPSASALPGSIPSAAWREGPWHARPSIWRDHDARKPIFDDGLWIVCQEDRFKVPVATIDSGDDHSAVTREKAEYTARLIAAAPELYEALEELWTAIMGKPVGGGDGQTFTVGTPSAANLNKANAALRKARGEA